MPRPDDKYVTRQEKRMRQRMRSIFKRQSDYIIEEAKKLYPTQNFYSHNELNSRAVIIIDQILGYLPEVTPTADLVVYFRSAVYTREAKRLIKELGMDGFGVTFDSVNPKSVKRLELRKQIELSERLGSITKTTKDDIRKILLDGMQSGEDYVSLSQRIQKLSKEGVFSQARGELIAVTEIGQAYGEGNWDVMQEFKQKNPDRQPVKKWVTVSDTRVRESHTANEDDGWIPMEREHSGTGEMFAPSHDFRCRCFERYSIGEEYTLDNSLKHFAISKKRV